MRVQMVITTMSLVMFGVRAEVPLGARATDGAAEAQTQPAQWEPFEGTIHGCSSTAADDSFLTPGGVRHFKGGSNVNLWVTDHPLVNGIDRNIVDANINFNAGVGRAHLVAILTPENVAGSWDIRALVRIVDGSPSSSSGVGAGRGALEGLRIEFTTEAVPGSPNQCTPGFGGVRRVRGTVRGEA
jgi:hypothetical protein